MANLITIARMLLVIPLTALFYVGAPWAMPAALGVFLVAAASDFLDGYVARARNEVSAVGAALDPVADKVLVAAALLLLVRNGVIRDAAVIAALIIFLRDLVIGGLREALSARAGSLPVTALAKVKTAAQLVAVALLLATAPGGVLSGGFAVVATGALWFAAVLTLWTGADYVRRGLAALNAPPARTT